MKRNQTNKMQLETQTKEEQINVVKELCKITNVLRCNKQLNAQKKKKTFESLLFIKCKKRRLYYKKTLDPINLFVSFFVFIKLKLNS